MLEFIDKVVLISLCKKIIKIYKSIAIQKVVL